MFNPLPHQLIAALLLAACDMSTPPTDAAPPLDSSADVEGTGADAELADSSDAPWPIDVNLSDVLDAEPQNDAGGDMSDDNSGDATDASCLTDQFGPLVVLELGAEAIDPSGWMTFTAPSDGRYLFYNQVSYYSTISNFSNFTNNGYEGLDVADLCVEEWTRLNLEAYAPPNVHTPIVVAADLAAGQEVAVTPSSMYWVTDVRIEGPCTGDCSTKPCGYDGCGGFCPDTCPSETPLCIVDECAAYPPGGNCLDPQGLVLDQLPKTVLAPCAAFVEAHPEYTDCPLPMFPREDNFTFPIRCFDPEATAKEAPKDGGYSSGSDWVYAVTAPASGSYKFTLTPLDSSFHESRPSLALLEACQDSAPCLGGGAGDGGSTPAELTVQLLAGQTYYLVVDVGDHWDTPYFHVINDWRLDISEGTLDCATASCGTDGCSGVCGLCPATEFYDPDGSVCVPEPPAGNCATATPVSAPPGAGLSRCSVPLDWTDDYDSHHMWQYAPEYVTSWKSYNYWGWGQPDEVHTFTAPAGADYAFTATAAVEITLAENCLSPAVPNADGSAPISGFSKYRVRQSLSAGQTVSIIVNDAGSAGQADLVVTRCACDGLSCGDDGCGGSCGDCAGNAACLKGQCVAPGVGATCANPLVLDGGPASASLGDWMASNINLDLDQATCGATQLGNDAPAFAQFVAPQDGLYRIETNRPAFVVEDCSSPTPTCLGATPGKPLLGQGHLDLFLEADQPIVVVVDALSYGFETTIRVGPVPPPCD